MATDATKIKYDLAVMTPEGDKVFLSEFIQGGVWEENNEEFASRLEVRLENKRLQNGKYVNQYTPLGGKVYLYANWGLGWQEAFRGTIFSWDYTNDGNPDFSITAYDNLYYLMNSEDDLFYKAGTTARAIIQDIANKWSIPIGMIDVTDVPLAKQIFRGKKLADCITDVLEQTKQKGGSKWVVRSKEGKMYVIRPGFNTFILHFGADDNVSSSHEQRSIEKLVTRVKVMGTENDNARTSVAATLDGRTEFGVLQRLVYSQQHDNLAAAKAAAQDILKEEGQPVKKRKLVAADHPHLRKGEKIHVAAGTLLGHFIITGITRDIKTGRMVMEVEDLE